MLRADVRWTRDFRGTVLLRVRMQKIWWNYSSAGRSLDAQLDAFISWMMGRTLPTS